MKKNWLAFACITLMTLVLFACNKEETPEEAASRYIQAWNKQQFENMYEQLSNEAKNVIDQETFIERHQKIYDGIRLSKLEIKPNFPEEKLSNKEDEVNVEYEIKMNTIAGELHFTHVLKLVKEETEEEKRWAVAWNPSLIFPQMEEGDKVRVETLPAKRGEIIDRNGEGLAVNGKALDIGIVPERLPENETASFEQLAEILQLPIEMIESKRNASWVEDDMFVPITTISKDDRRLNKLLKIQGVTYLETDARIYPFKETTAHLTGYVQEINAEELKKLKDKGYREGDIIGKSGLEKVFEDKLSGKDGGRIYIVDDEGNEKEEIAKQEPVDGETIQLTIDAKLQTRIFNQLKNERGTAAAIHPQTGEVLALVSAPSYDPNQFVLGMTNSEWQTLNEDPGKPLLNRFSITYAPGSVIKPLTGAIALDANAIDKNTTFDVKGLKWQADKSWGDYFVTRVTDPKKPVDLETAMIFSDNIYFAQAALKTGEKQFLEGMKRFGFGESVPFEYPIKKSSITDEKTFKNEIELADSGYGQGKVEMSIVHLASAYTAFLNEGNVLKPILLKTEAEKGKQIWKERAAEPDTASFINDLLVQVVHHPDGTGNGAKLAGKQMAGKTGTAELKKTKNDNAEENGLFVAYDNKQQDVIVAMLVENVKERGGSKYVVSKVKTIFSD